MIDIRMILGIAVTSVLARSAMAQIVPPDDISVNFGIALHAMPDVDGDGWADFLVGDNFAPQTVGQSTFAPGAVFVYSGRTQRPLTRIDAPAPQGTMDWDAWFGFSLASIATTATASGRAVVAGAPYYDTDAALLDNGLVFVADPETGQELFRIEHPAGLERQAFGWSVAAINDLTGDSIDEILVGNFPLSGSIPGKIFLCNGANGSLIDTIDSPLPDAGAIAFGYSVSAIPDVTGDGVTDIVGSTYVGASGDKRGLVHIFNGQNRQFVRTFLFPRAETGATAEAVDFGGRVLGIPDVTGDGRGDLLATAARATRVNPSTLQIQTGLILLFDAASGDLNEWFWNSSLPSDPDRLDTVGGSLSYLPDGLEGGEPLVFAGGTNFNQDWQEDLGGAMSFIATNQFAAGKAVKPTGYNRLGLGYSMTPLERPGRDPALLMGQPETEGRVFLLDATTGQVIPPPDENATDVWIITGNSPKAPEPL